MRNMAKSMVLTISGETVDDLKEKVVELAGTFGLRVQATVPVVQDAVAEKPKASKKAAPAPVAQAASNPFDDQPHVVGSPLTRDNLLEALQSVNALKGTEAVKEILQKTLGVTSMSKVEPKDYGKMIAACKSAVESA